MAQISEIVNVLDPYDDPQEGIDFYVDQDVVSVPERNITAAARILRRVNSSGLFDTGLVNLGVRGDSIILAFDTAYNTPALHTALIGQKLNVLAEVKTDGHNFYIYVDGKRKTRVFKTKALAKRYVKQLDQQLCEATTVNSYDDVDTDE